MTQTPGEAAQHLIDTLTAALTNPTLDDQVEAAAYNAHHIIQTHGGGDTPAAFRDTRN
ncbi:hypothetical protein ACFVS9_28305 [Streptomyces sp. NPDC058008]|uniref:hypothetical protein n=1 Tax=Streptomyces sp. NPDC058008 TaxID=3346303 RepID=UPI0036E5AC07